MRTFEFNSRLGPHKTLAVPEELASQVGPDESLRVIVVVGGADEEGDWRRLTEEQFLQGYSDRDVVYDDV